MRQRRLRTPQASTDVSDHKGPLESAFHSLRDELKLAADYPADAVREAEQAIGDVPLPDRDETGVPFFTIDPSGSMDLDQAMFLERDGEGYRVRYAIADVPAYVRPGGALDAEVRRRGQTIYFPDARIPLHPAVLSEDAVSLLPDQVRSAYVWDFRLDAAGEVSAFEVYRAQVKSVQRYDYQQVQSDVDAGTAPEGVVLLQEIGEKRIALERSRGGANLPMPDQEVTVEDGHYQMQLRPPVPSEDWNAQISLMTGMAAADLMLRAKVGILRTMPAPDEKALATFRRQAQALGVEWQKGQTYGDLLRSLDRDNGSHLALIYSATALFRGAGYTPFDGEVPKHTEQAAVAAPYAHVTAPLRRLVDRFGLVICEAVSSGTEIPAWAREALADLPDIMKSSDTLAGAAERGCVDAVEAALLSDQVGNTFDAVVVDERGDDDVLVQLTEIPVIAVCQGDAELGSQVGVTVVSADIKARKVEFSLA
ncbi:RNB domain-containing ribonuclease [Demetria terragena]|uniref:RNB domain-containing ribonuclease n=1 Tax=Demetria terragena TaxID=63959 RepID=UPI00036E78AB|nr:RNB domain-containing ribonuclease [Demetria terragena]